MAYQTMRKKLIKVLGYLKLTRWLPDACYLRIRYWGEFGEHLDLENPKTFSEKLQWIKLFDRRPEYTTLVDKVAVKDWVAARIGAEYVIPTLGIWDRFDDIDFGALPDRFVLKCTHDSGGLCICKDKITFDRETAKTKITRSLNRNYFPGGREWPYQAVPRRILAETYLEAENGVLADYKFHCFNGEPKVILVCQDRYETSGLTEDFFTADWTHLEVGRPDHPHAKTVPARPKNLDKMLEIARMLSIGIPFVRVDLYDLGTQVYFGEMTFFPASGLKRFEPQSFDDEMGSWLLLPAKKEAKA